jgi:hypothetical protein
MMPDINYAAEVEYIGAPRLRKARGVISNALSIPFLELIGSEQNPSAEAETADAAIWGSKSVGSRDGKVPFCSLVT